MLGVRRRKKKNRILLLCALCMVLAGVALYVVLRPTATPASAQSAPSPAAPAAVSPTPVATSIATPTLAPAVAPEGTPEPAGPDDDPYATPSPTAFPAAGSADTMQRTPMPTPALSPSSLSRSRCRAALEVDGKAAAVQGRMRLSFVNPLKDTLYSVSLRLAANAFSPGSLELLSAALNGEAVACSYADETRTLLVLPLIRELRTGEGCDIYLCFRASVPAAKYGYGLRGRAMELTDLLPAAVQDAQSAPLAADYIINVEGASAQCEGMEATAEGGVTQLRGEAMTALPLVLSW